VENLDARRRHVYAVSAYIYCIWRHCASEKIVLLTYFCFFFANSRAIEKLLFKSLSARIILVLVPNLMFLSLLSCEISFGKKKQSPTQTLTYADTQLISPSMNLRAPQ